MDNRIKVGVRIRPLSSKEIGENASSTVHTEPGGKVVTYQDSKKNNFNFDWSFDSDSSQRAVYDSMCKPLIDRVFEGYNATFFAYGQTGAGKTYTMGTTSDLQHGVVPYCLNDIFTKRSELIKSGAQVGVELSYLEIYMEDCFDLLSKDGERKKLELRETSNGETFLEGLSAWPVVNLAEVSRFLTEAAKVRATGRTAMNAVSSRSHAICTLTIRVYKDEETLVSKLNLVDLAGSERAKKTMATGDAFQEGVSINKGLLALGNVVSALSAKSEKKINGGHVHVPYRESRLTRLLKDSLGGNGMTALLACVSPASSNFEETVNTLRFASRTSSIVNKAEINHDNQSDAGALIREVSKLREQLMNLQEKYDTLASAGGKAVVEKNGRNRQDSRESATSSNNEDMVLYIASSLKLTSSLKSILMQCITEDIEMDDTLIMTIQNELQDIRQTLGYEFTAELGAQEGLCSQSLLLELSIDGLVMDDVNMPPIMTTIDELNHLEGHLQSLLRKHSQSDDITGNIVRHDNPTEEDMINMSAISKDSNEMHDQSFDVSVMQAEMSFAEHEAVVSQEELEAIGAGAKDIAAKEEKICNIVAITEQYKATIKELNEEISALEREREAMVAQHDNDSQKKGGKEAGVKDINHDTLKFKQELKTKTRLLEEKIKTLRAKEIEFNKICRVKERLVKELDTMRNQVQEYKRKKVDIMRKMREETVAHQEESKQLKLNEMQSKRKVQKAEISLQRVEQKLTNQEKFWKLKLEAKENECNRLKQLMKKQEENRVIKEKYRLPRPFNSNNNVVANAAAGNGSNNALMLNSKQIQAMFRDELRNQQDMAKLHGELSFHYDVRKNLQQNKLNKKAQLKKLRPNSHTHRQLDDEIQVIEKEIAVQNKKISSLQLTLHEQSELSAHAQGNSLAHRLPFLSKDPNSINLYSTADVQSCLQRLWAMQFETMKENMKMNMKLEDLQQQIAKSAPTETVIEVGDEEDGDNLDETFYPSEEESEFEKESEDEDIVVSVKRTNNKKKRNVEDDSDPISSKASKRSRTSSLNTVEDADLVDSFESEDSNNSNPKKNAKRTTKKSFAEEDVEAIKNSKWFAFTIKDLKTHLAMRSLPVSGVKNELVYRLMCYDKEHPEDVQEQVMDIEEETCSSPPNPSSSPVPKKQLTIQTSENDENIENAPPNSALSPFGKGTEMGKQLLSPIRALVKENSGELGGSSWVLSQEEKTQAFNARFHKYA